MILGEIRSQMKKNNIGIQLGSDKQWDIAGTIFGLVASVAIMSQLLSEFNRQAPSTLSFGFVFGFLLVYGFWLFYGLRFKRPALIISNVIAFSLQLALLVVILL